MTKLPRVSEARKALANRLIEYQRGGESDQEFARRIGITPNTWSAWKSGTASGLPSLPVLLHSAKSFGLLVEDLLADQDPEYDQHRIARLAVLRLIVHTASGKLEREPEALPASEAEKMADARWLDIGPLGEKLTTDQRTVLQAQAYKWIADAIAGRGFGGATGTGVT